MENIKVASGPVVDELKDNYFGIEWIDTEKLIVDPNYQRPLVQSLIKAISEAWDWRAVRTLAVSMRSDGTYAVMDGQQRLTSARKINITKLPCQVYLDLTEKQEAELFLKLNNSMKPNANDMFRAKLAEGDEEARVIIYCVHNAGWTLNLDAKARGNSSSPSWCATEIASATALTEIYRAGGALHLTSVLNVAHGWFGETLAGSADMIGGIHHFLMKYRNKIDMSHLTSRLADETPSGILGKTIQVIAAERAAGITGQGTRKKAMSRVLMNLYNKGRKASNRLED